MIRLRRVERRTLIWRRRRYEIEFPSPVEGGNPVLHVTSTPVTAIDRFTGQGDAWALVHAADDAWDGQSGEWVSLSVEDDDGDTL